MEPVQLQTQTRMKRRIDALVDTSSGASSDLSIDGSDERKLKKALISSQSTLVSTKPTLVSTKLTDDFDGDEPKDDNGDEATSDLDDHDTIDTNHDTIDANHDSKVEIKSTVPKSVHQIEKEIGELESDEVIGEILCITFSEWEKIIVMHPKIRSIWDKLVKDVTGEVINGLKFSNRDLLLTMIQNRMIAPYAADFSAELNAHWTEKRINDAIAMATTKPSPRITTYLKLASQVRFPEVYKKKGLKMLRNAMKMLVSESNLEEANKCVTRVISSFTSK